MVAAEEPNPNPTLEAEAEAGRGERRGERRGLRCIVATCLCPSPVAPDLIGDFAPSFNPPELSRTALPPRPKERLGAARARGLRVGLAAEGEKEEKEEDEED